jgi:hypothetical protein
MIATLGCISLTASKHCSEGCTSVDIPLPNPRLKEVKITSGSCVNIG